MLTPTERIRQARAFLGWHDRLEGVTRESAFDCWCRSKGFDTEDRTALWRLTCELAPKAEPTPPDLPKLAARYR